jgi:multidrug efflux pump subunit AcrB
VPFFFLSGITKYLFVPLAEAVIGAMLASYLLSRTLLPTLAMYGLGKEVVAHTDGTHRRVQQLYDRLRERYASALRAVLGRSSLYLLSAGCALIIALAFALPIGGSPGLGSSLFPKVDAGQMKLHIRAPTGTRIESTAAICDRVEARIRSLIPSAELLTIADNIGLPYSAINTVYSNSAPIGPGDADILISLRPGHRPTAAYIAELRAHLPEAFPDVSFAFLPADIISQILNFGTPVPIDVQIRGNDVPKNRVYANALLKKIRQIPDAVDVRVQQAFDYPELHVDVDRAVAQQYGVTQQDVARSLLLSLSGSFQTEPQFWTEKSSGSQYNVNVQSPQYRIATFNDLAITPIDSSDHPVSGDAPLPLLADMATFRRAVGPAAISHYNSVSTIDIFSDVQSADLGTFMRRVGDAIEGLKAEIPKGTTVTVRGQAQTMVGTFHELVLGTGMALVLIYLLIMVNFQSWKDPLIIIATLPFALVGVIAAHFFTGTTPSVPSLIGTIMCMGIATANSILVVSFAREQKAGGAPAAAAAITAGVIRLRPVLMTALAMIVGMLPAAIGFGEGGEQNAPLGRAVIGGLIAATLATLFLVPALYGLIHRETS